MTHVMLSSQHSSQTQPKATYTPTYWTKQKELLPVELGRYNKQPPTAQWCTTWLKTQVTRRMCPSIVNMMDRKTTHTYTRQLRRLLL